MEVSNQEKDSENFSTNFDTPALLSHVVEEVSIDTTEEYKAIETDTRDNEAANEKISVLDSSVLAFISAFRSTIISASNAQKELLRTLSIQPLDEGANVIRDHAKQNIVYCEYLTDVLTREKLTSGIVVGNFSECFTLAISDFLGNYLRSTPALWSENVILNQLLRQFLPFTMIKGSSSMKSGKVDLKLSSNDMHTVIPDSILEAVSVAQKYIGGSSHSSSGSPQTAVDLHSTSVYAVSEFDDASDTQSHITTPGIPSKKSTAIFTAKKAAQNIHKLKSEIAVLRDQLYNSNLTDVSILGKKLRSANNDLTRIRALNFELKDRIQLLEESLYRAVSKREDKKEDRKDDRREDKIENMKEDKKEYTKENKKKRDREQKSKIYSDKTMSDENTDTFEFFDAFQTTENGNNGEENDFLYSENPIHSGGESSLKTPIRNHLLNRRKGDERHRTENIFTSIKKKNSDKNYSTDNIYNIVENVGDDSVSVSFREIFGSMSHPSVDTLSKPQQVGVLIAVNKIANRIKSDDKKVIDELLLEIRRLTLLTIPTLKPNATPMKTVKIEKTVKIQKTPISAYGYDYIPVNTEADNSGEVDNMIGINVNDNEKNNFEGNKGNNANNGNKDYEGSYLDTTINSRKKSFTIISEKNENNNSDNNGLRIITSGSIDGVEGMEVNKDRETPSRETPSRGLQRSHSLKLAEEILTLVNKENEKMKSEKDNTERRKGRTYLYFLYVPVLIALFSLIIYSLHINAFSGITSGGFTFIESEEGLGQSI